MEVRARVMRSCGQTRGVWIHLNSLCEALPLPQLPGEQQGRSQPAWGILQQLQQSPAEEVLWGRLSVPGTACKSHMSLHSYGMPKRWELLP